MAMTDPSPENSVYGTVTASSSGNATIGLQAVAESNVISQVRLPMLEVVCDRMVRTFTSSFRNLTYGNVDVEFNGLVTVRFGEFLARQDGRSLLGVFTIEELENFGLLTLDRQLARDVIETLLGSRLSNVSTPSEARIFTTLDITLVSEMMEVALAELAAAFKEVREIKIKLDRIESSIHFATITGNSNLAVVGEFTVGLGTRRGQMSVLFPFTTLEPIRERLQQRFMGDQRNLQSVWDEHLRQEVLEIEIGVSAVLGELAMTLDDIMNLKTGDLIPFNVLPNAPVKLQSGDIELGQGYVGQNESKLALSLAGPIG
jgi:flagellar motor switch protein FliM